MSKIITKPSLLDALVPVFVLVTMLGGLVYVFGNDSAGPNQVALMLAASVAAIIGIKNGQTWKEIESSMITTISVSMQAILMLLMVGALIGSWMLSGTVPTMIYYKKPLHLQKAFANLGYQVGDFPVSEKASDRIFSLPMHPYLDNETIAMIVEAMA